ncbi:DmpA/ArgJ-like protein [Trichoderma chlorosporum]
MIISSKESTKPRIRGLGYAPGKFTPGPRNSILDVDGVRVGQATIHQEPGINTGVTVILPRGPEETALSPCYAATHGLNAAGEMTGAHMIYEWGHLACPIAITNTISVGKVYDALFLWCMEQARKRGENDLEALRRFTIPVVAETFDGYLNDICASVVDRDVVNMALAAAQHQPEVLEGNHGGGTAMICSGYKGGTGTSSRIVPGPQKNYTLGVIVQANHGGRPDLRIADVPVGRLLMDEDRKNLADETREREKAPEGGKAMEGNLSLLWQNSMCSILSNSRTDAPLLPHQLKRVAQHAGVGVAQVSGHSAGRNFSGEIFLAFSTGTSPNKLAEASDGMSYLPPIETQRVDTVRNETIDALLYAVSEATEEAILNALCQAETLTGFQGRTIEGLPLDRVQKLLNKYMVPK